MFGVNEWSNIWHTRQHLGSRLAQRGWRVIYSTGQPFSYQRRTKDWWARPWIAEHRVQNRVIISKPGWLRTRCERLPWWDRYVSERHAQDLMEAVGWKETRHRILYVSYPKFWPYVKYLGDSHVVYHADDAFSLMPDWTPEEESMQAHLVARADLILASSEAIARLLPNDGPQRARLFPNAADAVAYMKARDEPCPEELSSIPHPRIGYTGSINLKVDLPLITTIASQKPDWHWVLVGPLISISVTEFPATRAHAEALAACRKSRNIHFVGPKSFRDVPSYMAHMDVNAMCYRHEPGGWWTAIHPLKLYEYLAVGQPVVSADIEAVRPFSSVLAIADSAKGWIHAIMDALETGGVGTAHSRQAVAIANTWEHRVAQLVRWIQELADHNERQTNS